MDASHGNIAQREGRRLWSKVTSPHPIGQAQHQEWLHGNKNSVGSIGLSQTGPASEAILVKRFSWGAADPRMSGLRHFATILVATGRFYVAGDGRIFACELPR